MTAWPIRPATAAEMPTLATVWAAGWHEVHAAHVPDALLRRRTRAEFEERLDRMGDGLRVAGPVGGPLGLCATREDELHRFHLAPAARGSGLAARLLSDGEARPADAGLRQALAGLRAAEPRGAALLRPSGMGGPRGNDRERRHHRGPVRDAVRQVREAARRPNRQ